VLHVGAIKTIAMALAIIAIAVAVVNAMTVVSVQQKL
jgi:hypothetical protein